MADSLLTFLQTLLDDAASELPFVKPKRMFGCYCLFAKNEIFAAVWKSGRINIKLPDAKRYQALLALDGSEPWKIGKVTMSHWILVPESFHDDTSELNNWFQEAYRLASSTPKKVKKIVRKKPKLSTRTKAPNRVRR